MQKSEFIPAVDRDDGEQTRLITRRTAVAAIAGVAAAAVPGLTYAAPRVSEMPVSNAASFGSTGVVAPLRNSVGTVRSSQNRSINSPIFSFQRSRSWRSVWQR